MKGYYHEMKIAGLRPDYLGERNSHLLTKAVNVRGKKTGLEGYTPPIIKFPHLHVGGVDYDTSVGWPFPQLFLTDSGLYLCDATGIYLLSVSGGQWSATLLSTVYTHGVLWPYTLANCPLFPVFASGDLLMYYDYDNTRWSPWNKSYSGATYYGTKWSTDWYQPIAACFHRGQVFTCGSRIATTSPSQSRIVRWSGIGEFDFLGKTADARKNTAGYAYAPYNDNEILQRVLPLGDTIIVYGGHQIYALDPVVEPAPTFKVRPIKDIGISNPLAVNGRCEGGDEDYHVFIDTKGHMWHLGTTIYGRFKLERLGFQEFFRPMLVDPSVTYARGLINIVFNSREDEFYISDGNLSYLLSKDMMLTEINKRITSFVDLTAVQITDTTWDNITDFPVGYFSFTGEKQAWLRTDILDMGLRAIKTIENVEVSGNFIGQAEVMVEWRNDSTKAFRETPWRLCNHLFVGTPIVSGMELRINIRVTPFDGAEVQKVKVAWKLSDKRHIRGNYAGGTTAGASS